jgi:hypothetical protein
LDIHQVIDALSKAEDPVLKNDRRTDFICIMLSIIHLGGPILLSEMMLAFDKPARLVRHPAPSVPWRVRKRKKEEGENYKTKERKKESVCVCVSKKSANL